MNAPRRHARPEPNSPARPSLQPAKGVGATKTGGKATMVDQFGESIRKGNWKAGKSSRGSWGA